MKNCISFDTFIRQDNCSPILYLSWCWLERLYVFT